LRRSLARRYNQAKSDGRPLDGRNFMGAYK
jgi:hypothetical protein